MRNMCLISDSTTKELSQHHVQLLNTTFTNKKKRLDSSCFNEPPPKSLEKQDSESVLQQEATHDKINVENEFEVEEELAEAEVIANLIAWDNLAVRIKQRRLKSAACYMREHALPFLRKCVHPMDDDGRAPFSDGFLMSEVLRYGVRDAKKNKRISPTLSFPEMLLHYVVDAITALARGEQKAEEKREMRIEALPDWLMAYQRSAAEVYRILRRILPDWMLPSMYQLDNFKETLTQEYRTYS